jgi:hypothetical protein
MAWTLARASSEAAASASASARPTGRTLEEVGQQFSVRRECIRQIEAKAPKEAEASEQEQEASLVPRQLISSS